MNTTEYERKCSIVRGTTDRLISELMSAVDMDHSTALRLICVQAIIRMDAADIDEMERFIVNEVSSRGDDEEG
jgi:hypothetical protein